MICNFLLCSETCFHIFPPGNHLYDYIQRKNKVIDGHDDASQFVSDPSVCAQMCSSGDGLPGCASFEICQVQIGQTKCIMSKADPTAQSDLNIIPSTQCTLFTSRSRTYSYQRMYNV